MCGRFAMNKQTNAGEFPGRDADEHFLAAGCDECVMLSFGVLFPGGDAPVSDPHTPDVSPAGVDM